MFEELARLRFFIPKQKLQYRRTDKYPIVVMEAIADKEYIIRGKFPDEGNAKLFLDLLRQMYVEEKKREMTQAIEEVVGEQR